MSQALNFSVEFYESDDAASEQWGSKTENGSYTGLLGEMVRFSIDTATKMIIYGLNWVSGERSG